MVPMVCSPLNWWSQNAQGATFEPLSLPPFRQAKPPPETDVWCSLLSEENAKPHERTCVYSGLCYSIGAEDDEDTDTPEFFGTFSNDSSGSGFAEALRPVGVSLWSDGRSLWRPLSRPPLSESEDVFWIDQPTYIAKRHSPQNFAHQLVETWLGLYAQMLANEDESLTPNGQRLVFFVDDCSPSSYGDSVDYCIRYFPDAIGCIQAIAPLCGKFTRQLGQLLSDWTPVEPGSLRQFVRGLSKETRPAELMRPKEHINHVCFSSVRAGMASWRRPLEMNPNGFGLWAPDSTFGSIVRLFRAHSLQRLGVSFQKNHVHERRVLAHAVKVNRHIITNREEMLSWLATAAEARGLELARVDFAQSLAEQASMLARAALLVTSAGANHVAGLFLPAGAGMLLLPMCKSSGQRLLCQSERLFAAVGLRWVEYPVLWEDASYDIHRGFSVMVRKETLDKTVADLLRGSGLTNAERGL
ncbi:unnamed protein product [Polarella glacialis]|uniref:Uncharacterized protein n=1 Tax=Polarella glacialis TaxID=89957 RepID=A0A813HWZ7_POLGL|nr:unnamed protein product [Polarella glacialis]